MPKKTTSQKRTAQDAKSPEAPKEWQDGKVVLPPDGKQQKWLTQSHCQKHKGIPKSLFQWFICLLPASHLKEVDYGYYKTFEITQIAGNVFFGNRAFFEHIRSVATNNRRQARSAKQGADLKALAAVASSSGQDVAALTQKHEALAGMAAAGNLELVADMFSAGVDGWFYDALLAGTTLNEDGRLALGEPLRRLGRVFAKAKGFRNAEMSKVALLFAEGIGALALRYAPEGGRTSSSLGIQYLRRLVVIGDTFAILCGHVLRHYTAIAPVFDDESGLHFLMEAKELSDESAEVLSRYSGDLDLRSLEQVSDTGMAALAKHKGTLCLSGLKVLTDKAAATLATHGGIVELRGLKELKESLGHLALANKLASDKCEYGTLSLADLEAVSTGAALALAKYDGGIDFWSLPTLSEGVAEALSKHKGELNFNGLKTLSEIAAHALAKHSGGLILDALEDLSETVAVALAESKGRLSLISLHQLKDPVAAALGRHKGCLNLGGVTSLSDAAVQALAHHAGDLDLSGLKSLSEAAAQALAQHEGELSLSGLTTLSDAAAESLSNHEGEFFLSGKAKAKVSRFRRKKKA